MEHEAITNKRHFYIDVETLKKWSGWKPNIKKDIDNLVNNIDLEVFMNNVKKMLEEFKKDISFISKFEIIGAIKILDRYHKVTSTPYITIEFDDFTKNKGVQILPLFDELVVAKANIQKLGFVLMSVWDKEKGFVVYDPYDLQFTKEEKEKFGFN